MNLHIYYKKPTEALEDGMHLKGILTMPKECKELLSSIGEAQIASEGHQVIDNPREEVETHNITAEPIAKPKNKGGRPKGSKDKKPKRKGRKPGPKKKPGRKPHRKNKGKGYVMWSTLMLPKDIAKLKRDAEILGQTMSHRHRAILRNARTPKPKPSQEIKEDNINN